MDVPDRAFKPVRELFRVRLQPVAGGRLPAVVYLEQVAGQHMLRTASEIARDTLGVDILIAVIPARIAAQPFCAAAFHAHRRKPAVEYRVLAALGIVKLQRREHPAATDTRAVARYGQYAAAAVVAKQGIARALIEGRDEPVIPAAAEIAVALAVHDAGGLRVINEEIVAVTVYAEFVDDEFWQLPHAARKAVLALLRAIRPRLVAIDEEALVLSHRDIHARRDSLYPALRQHGFYPYAAGAKLLAAVEPEAALKLDHVVQLHVFPPVFSVFKALHRRGYPPAASHEFRT